MSMVVCAQAGINSEAIKMIKADFFIFISFSLYRYNVIPLFRYSEWDK